MKTLYLIVSVNREVLREHLKKGRSIPNTTRMETIKYYVPTYPQYAVERLADAIVLCREWNRQKYHHVHYWAKLELYELSKPAELKIG